MMSTPYNAYKLLRALGIGHEIALILSTNRTKFEYFLEVIWPSSQQ